MSSSNRVSLISFFLIYMPFFSCLISVSRTSILCCIKVASIVYPCLVILEEKLSALIFVELNTVSDLCYDQNLISSSFHFTFFSGLPFGSSIDDFTFLTIHTYKHIAVIKESVTCCQGNVFFCLVHHLRERRLLCILVLDKQTSGSFMILRLS